MKTFITLILMVLIVACGEIPGAARYSGPKTKVLMIGDSISRGYSPFVRQFLANTFDVRQVLEPDGVTVRNAENSTFTLAHVDEWLKKCPDCQIIVWNNGLWDCTRADVSRQQAAINQSEYYNTDEQYKRNIESIADKLKATGAKVLFVTSTELPSSTAYFFDVGREEQLNAIALQALMARNVSVYDLHAVSLTVKDLHQFPGTPHYNDSANVVLGDFVAKAILQVGR